MKQVIFANEKITEHRCLADSIKSNLQVDSTVISEKEVHSSYNANLPDGITPDTVTELSKYNGRFSKAAHVAVMETAAEVFNAHKDISKVEAKLGYFAAGDSMKLTVSREKTYTNNFAAEGAPKNITKYLETVETVELKGMSVKSLKQSMSAEFQEKFVK